MLRSAPDPEYLAFLRSRWPSRIRRLASYALLGDFLVVLFDWVYTRHLPVPPGLDEILRLRAPWAVIPLLGFAVQRVAPRWRGLPAFTMVISVAWAWGLDAGFFALGLQGTVVQSTCLLISLVTTATFVPLTLRGRAGILALMALGQVALDVAWPERGTLGLRLWNDAIMLAYAVSITVIFESFAASQQRGLRLRRELERTVVALEKARRLAEEGVAEVGRLAAAVAHDVNNPLSAVKANIRWLGESGQGADADGDRAEAVADALSAVERISRIVADLRRRAVERASHQLDDPMSPVRSAESPPAASDHMGRSSIPKI